MTVLVSASHALLLEGTAATNIDASTLIRVGLFLPKRDSLEIIRLPLSGSIASSVAPVLTNVLLLWSALPLQNSPVCCI